jgi:peptide/nickel transport system ATP-binding protein
MSLLEVQDLSVTIPTRRSQVLAVDGLSYTVDRGEILAIVGESGCGKSIGVLALTGLEPEGSILGGRALYEGTDLLTLKGKPLQAYRGREIAYIFQDPMTALNPLMKAGDQVDEMLRLHTGLTAAERKARVVELFELIDIPSPAERAGLYPHQLSGGMRQRVMIAMAIACDPKLLIADEPTTALDVTVQAGILELIGSLRERLEMAVLLITHDMGVVAETADRVVVMYAGRDIEQGTVTDVLVDPRHPYTRGLLQAVPATGQWVGENRLSGIPGTVPTMHESLPRCGFADRCAVAVERCLAERPPLAGDSHQVACWLGVDQGDGSSGSPGQAEGAPHD